MVEDYKENYVSGWIKLFRSVRTHWTWSKNKKLTYFEAWITILLEVNHVSEKVLIDNELLTCDRGQKLYSIQSWAKLFNWSVQNVRTFFALLEKDKMIVCEGLRKTTRLTVCNYANYQNNQQTNNEQVTNRQQTDNEQVTTIEELKNEKQLNNENNIYVKNSRFESFWNLYDKKVGDKEKIRKKFLKLSEKEIEMIFIHIQKYKEATPDKKYRKNPETYLNNKSWNDEIIKNETNWKNNGRGFESDTTARTIESIKRGFAEIRNDVETLSD